MNVNKLIAVMLALALLTLGTAGALAEGGSLGGILGGLLDHYLGEEEADESAAEPGSVEGLSDEWLNILLLGSDSRTDEKHTLTDTMIVLSVNAGTGEAKLTSIMRDIWVNIPGHGSNKLNAACVYGGPELTVQVINDALNLNIESYVLVNMTCLAEMVDMLGGLRLDFDESERAAMTRIMEKYSSLSNNDPVTESGSQILLNGNQALAYARIRKLDSDYVRTERQRTFLTVLAKRLQQESMLSLTGILTSMFSYIETNLTFDQILTLASVGMSMNMDSISEVRIPADGTYSSGYIGSTWAIQPNFEANAQQLHTFIYGE